MRIVILGAGVVGITTAYELARSGQHQITVIDQAADVATEASAVNAAMIAAGHAFAWASPKVPAILLKSIYRNDQAFRIRLRFDYQFWKWTALFLRQCNERDAIKNTIIKHALCIYSQKRLNKIVAENHLEYEQVTKGLLYLHRHADAFKKGIEHSKILQDQGQILSVLSAEEVADLEPAFRPVRDKFAGAIYCPTDESGNSQLFTRKISNICKSNNVDFRFNEKVISLITSGNQISHVKTSKARIDADLFIVSLGAYSPLVLKPVGIDLPIYPVKGYSTSLTVEEDHEPIKIGTVDEHNLVALTPVGNTLRATSTAEFAGYDSSHKPKDFQPMLSAVQDLLPNGASYDVPIYKTCFRPMTPKGTPFIGFTKYENLFVNSGQGHMGWTMACGSAKIASDLISGQFPEIDDSPFRVQDRDMK